MRPLVFWLTVILGVGLCCFGCAGDYSSVAKESKEGRIFVATCQFPVSDDIEANGEWIRKQMRQGSSKGADIAHFSEGALSGYAGVDYDDFENYDWDKLRSELESIMALARELKLWVVLGSAHQLSGDNKPHNSLYLISPEGRIVDRYDKRFCTKSDLKCYSPGDHFVTFEINGVKCGLLICYDVRFPELNRQYSKLDVEMIFHSFYNARQKKGSIHPVIMPVNCQARAATNYMHYSATNSSAPRSWPGVFITPNGLIQNRLELDKPGVMVNLVDTTKNFGDASGPFRKGCIEGKFNSGDGVGNDPRSQNRQSY